jgi:hypothetical protein
MLVALVSWQVQCCAVQQKHTLLLYQRHTMMEYSGSPAATRSSLASPLQQHIQQASQHAVG